MQGFIDINKDSETNKSNTLVNSFIQALKSAERARRVTSDLTQLFAQDAKLWNLTRQNTHLNKGIEIQPCESVRAFWSQYLHAFSEIESFFTNIIDNGQCGVLEWHSKGTLPSGTPIEYSGVSILEYQDNQIHAFRTYYDSAALLPHARRVERAYSETVGEPELTDHISS